MARELPSGQRRLLARERQARALELRLAGASTPEIGRVLGVSRTTAWRLIDRALGELTEEVRERGEQLRALQARRLEEMVSELQPRLRAGDMAAGRLLVRVFERQGRLLGLDLERPADDEGPVMVNILFSTPSQREAPVVIEDAEFTEQPQIEAGGDDESSAEDEAE